MISIWRATLLILTVALALTATSVNARAQSDDDARKRADELNEEGKVLYRDGKLEQAIRKFRQAAVLSSEGRFYFNLCFVLDKQGKHRDALTACEAVTDSNAEERIVDKAEAYALNLREKLGSPTGPAPDSPGPEDPYPDGTEPPPTDPGPGTPPDAPPPGDGPQPPEPTPANYDDGPDSSSPGAGPGAAPTPFQAQAVEAARSRRGDYAWSLGAELGFAVANFGRDPLFGSGEDNAFSSTGQAVRLHADFMVSRKRRAGVRGYINLLTFDSNLPDAEMFDERLQVVDVGAALFQHRRIAPSLYLTYRGGAHIAVQSVGVGDDALTTFGLSAEGTVSYLFGNRRQHVISVTPAALGFYLPASDATATIDPAGFGLDSTAFAWSASVGYTFRFARAFGGIRVFGLE